MNQFIFKSKCRALVLAALFIPAPSFAAATLDDVVNALKQIYTFLDTQMLTNNWLGPQPNLQTTQTNNYSSAKLNNTVTSITGGGVADQSLLAISSVLGPNPNPSISASMLAFPAGDSYTFGGSGSTAQSQTQAVLSSLYGACGDNAFNFEMFMSPSTYSKVMLPCAPTAQDISTYAKAYVQYAADLGNPVSTYSINQLVTDNTVTPDQATSLMNSAEWTEFAQSRRHIIAAQSAGLSNLYYLTALRTPDSNGKSPLSLSDGVAYWRTNPLPAGANPSTSWYMQMQTALPAMVARETLFILAEMQRDLHDMRKENQRLLAIQSIMQLSSLSPSKQILNVKLTQVQNKVGAITAPPPSSTSTSTTSGTTNVGGFNIQTPTTGTSSSGTSSSGTSTGTSSGSMGGFTMPEGGHGTPQVNIPLGGSP